MSRQIKDIKDKNTGLLVYPRTHIKAVVINESTNLEDLIDTNVGERLDNIEQTIKTDGSGNLYLADDGSYKEVVTDLSEYIKTEDADETYATINSIKGKQDASLKFTDVAAAVWVEDPTYEEYPYRCDIACEGVTDDMYAEVNFSMEQAISGKYAPICETKTDIVSIWSNTNESITVPNIVITK